MKSAGNILSMGVQMLLDSKYLFCELFRFLKGRDFYYWRISDKDKERAFSLSILVYGRESIANDVVAAFFCNKEFTKTRLSRCHPVRASKVVSLFKEDRDSLIVRERHFWERGENETRFQTLLDTELTIQDREFAELLKQEIGKGTRRKVLSAWNLYRSQTRRTSDLDEILKFRQNFLIPSAEAIHGEMANTPTVEDLTKRADKLTLFVTEKEDKTQAGLLVILSKRYDSLRMWRFGAVESVLKCPKSKSLHNVCLFACALEMASKLNVKSLSCGLTPPVMNHGNLVYKLRLAFQPVLLRRYPTCSLECLGKREAQVFSRHPLLYIKDKKLCGMMGLAPDSLPDSIENHFRTFFRQFGFKRLSTIRCFVHKNDFDENFLDRIAKLELGPYAFDHAQVNEEHMILTFAATPDRLATEKS